MQRQKSSRKRMLYGDMDVPSTEDGRRAVAINSADDDYELDDDLVSL